MSITIAIPTYGRDEVLIDSISSLLELDVKADEIIIIDQTLLHNKKTESTLSYWDERGFIRWIRIQYPSITRAMNIGLRKAVSERILFLDDDIIPDKELVRVHIESGSMDRESIIAGRILQPWHKGNPDPDKDPFLFNSLKGRKVESFMGGNVSIPRDLAILIGGFDTNFVKVAYHFEAEFAYRWRRHGKEIIYEPRALIHHLKTSRGGTRSYGNHLKTIEPDHSVGRYYYSLCTRSLGSALQKSGSDLVRSVLTKHHLKHPGWIPLTLVAEFRGFIWSLLLYATGRGLIREKITLLLIASHPVQYTSPIYKRLSEIKWIRTLVFYLSIPDKRSQSLGFDKEFEWDVPLLEGYSYKVASHSTGNGLRSGFYGVQTKKPLRDLKEVTRSNKPDMVLLTGWHFYGMLQMFFVIIASHIPIILRMDSNNLKSRNRIIRFLYKKYISHVNIGLTVGKENHDFLVALGMKESQLISCPHVVDNEFFSTKASEIRYKRSEIRDKLGIALDSYCFIFVGKLQEKKRPFDLLSAYANLHRLLGDKVSLLIVGTGRLEKDCQDFTKLNSLPVSFAGFLNQSQIPMAYAVSDCIVLPSDADETWGLVINEAMACGLPAIVSDKVGCARDLVENGITGYTYNCGDIDQLSNVMKRMAINLDDSKAMGKNAEKLIKTTYTLESVVHGIEEAVTRLHG